MLSAFLLLAMIGQTPADQVGLVPDGQGGYQAHDDAGNPLRSVDKEWLKTYVAARNMYLAGKGKPPAAPPAYMVNGVETKLVGHEGKEWFGGNTTLPLEGSPGDAPPKFHLTVIGDDSSGIVEQWRRSPAFASIERSMGGTLAVQAFDDPTHPLVAEICLPNGGKPDVVIQSADGKVLIRWKSNPGAAAVAGQLRRCDPSYKAELDPAGNSEVTEDIERAVLIGLASLGGIFLLGKALK